MDGGIFQTAIAAGRGDHAVPPPAQPRAEGAARIVAHLAAGRSRIAEFRQQGSLKVLWPRGWGDPLQAVLLNTAGGLTGGDRQDFAAAAAAGAHLEITTQAAERAYRAQPGSEARVTTRLEVAAGARLDWLPQETILYDGAALERAIRADLAADARLLLVEPVIFGRRAMGETLTDIRFRDLWDIRRDGRRILADALRLEGDAERALERAACGAGARAMAGILMVAPEAEARLPGLRALLPVGAGASLARPGVIFARILAADGHGLRRILIPALAHLAGRPLTKVWSL